MSKFIRTPWSETPWYVHERDDRFYVANTENAVHGSSITGWVQVLQTFEDANRIVDCVNACVGMDDPMAEIESLHAEVAEAYQVIGSLLDGLKATQIKLSQISSASADEWIENQANIAYDINAKLIEEIEGDK